MRRLLIMLLAATAIATTSCKQFGYKKTKSGLEYKIIPGGSKDSLLKAGQIIKLNLEFSVQRKGKPDTILVSTYKTMPTYAMVDTSIRTQLSYMELLPLARTGDSLQFRVSVDTLKNKGLIDYQGPFEKGSFITGHLTIIKKFANEAEVNVDISKEVAAEKAKEYIQIKDYLAKNSINAVQTPDSAFVLVENPGDQTLKADSGKEVSIKYKGSLLDGGKVFDSNIDSVPGRPAHLDPIKIVIGSHQVIPGWEKTLPYFGKGGKGKIFIPATLAYGSRPQGADIPANSNLIFEIEVVDVKKAAPAPAAPQMPGLPHSAPQKTK